MQQCTHVENAFIEVSCTNVGDNLIRPPFLRKNKQFGLNDVANTEIAKARVHIDRAIQKIKIYLPYI